MKGGCCLDRRGGCERCVFGDEGSSAAGATVHRARVRLFKVMSKSLNRIFLDKAVVLD